MVSANSAKKQVKLHFGSEFESKQLHLFEVD